MDRELGPAVHRAHATGIVGRALERSRRGRADRDGAAPFEALDHADAVGLDPGDAQTRAALAARAQLHTRVASTAGTHERAPAFRRERLDEEELDAPSARVLDEDARGDHARVVDDETVT